jgi:YspA, cpYpsA-related SLOG family
MRVLVCGGRNYSDRAALFAKLDEIDRDQHISLIISGCAKGADTLALDWSRKWDLPVTMYPADWKAHGRAAGPFRNQLMIDNGKPDLVLAFSGGTGTADMVRRARTAGVRVIEVEG